MPVMDNFVLYEIGYMSQIHNFFEKISEYVCILQTFYDYDRLWFYWKWLFTLLLSV